MNREFLNNISIIIPSLNPDEKLQKTVNSLIEIGFSDIICINDGSREDCLAFFPSPDKKITLLVHEVNRGKGAALKTAFKYLKDNRKDSIGAITVDGDGQHTASDVLRCAEKMVKDGDKIILGCRDFSMPHVPSRSKIGNNITSGVFKVLCGMKISDTQTGLRAFPARYYRDMLEISGDRFEYETNMLLEMKARKIPYGEVKIETVYIEENKTSHFHPIKDSYRIYSLIFKFTFGRIAKFIASSLLSFVIDGVLVFLFLKLFTNLFDVNLEEKTLAAMAVTFSAKAAARIPSSLFNFTINMKIVFPSDMPLLNSLKRYYCLVIPILIISATLTAIFENFPIFNTAFLIMLLGYAIDAVLFIINYQVQKKWVFKVK